MPKNPAKPTRRPSAAYPGSRFLAVGCWRLILGHYFLPSAVGGLSWVIISCQRLTGGVAGADGLPTADGGGVADADGLPTADGGCRGRGRSADGWRQPLAGADELPTSAGDLPRMQMGLQRLPATSPGCRRVSNGCRQPLSDADELPLSVGNFSMGRVCSPCRTLPCRFL
jgi:hypothetical protein